MGCRHRGQALLPQRGSRVDTRFAVHHQIPCGSGLARESDGSVCIDVGWAAAIAGKPCSHRGSRVDTRFAVHHQIPCGSGWWR
ncbi:hypothetical protein CVG87_07140 [Pseudomonas sp. WCS365]|nr:hypothetical protein CVG87_07140 [Pseudomonas sp. WCS365]